VYNVCCVIGMRNVKTYCLLLLIVDDVSESSASQSVSQAVSRDINMQKIRDKAVVSTIQLVVFASSI
jgi:hypothetical protein